MSGIISDGGNGYGLTMVSAAGSGTLILSGDNSAANNGFSGGLTIDSGVVESLLHTSAFGAGSITLGYSGGSALVRLYPAYTGTYTNPIIVATGDTAANLFIYDAGSVAATFSGQITIGNASGTSTLT